MIPAWLPQESRVINAYLQQGSMTAGEAGKVLGVTTQAVWNHIDRLVKEGVLIVVGQKRQKVYGRVSDVYAVRGR